jgi:RND family efflux transporter MFP subunit
VKRNAFAGRVALALVVALWAQGCRKPPKEDEAIVRAVMVTSVGHGDLVESVRLVGELQGVEEVRVFAQVTERIRTLAVREGDRVKAGEVLATVRADLMGESVNQAQAALEAASSTREALEENIRRIRPLVEAGSAPRSQLEALEAQVRTAAAQVRQASAGLGQASAQRDRTTIRSPIAGVVAQINLRQGDMAPPTTPLLTVVRADRLKLVLRAPERDFLRIRPGMKVAVALLAEPARQVQAQITLVGAMVDRLTRTGLVEAELDNPGEVLVPGTSVRATIELDRQSGAVLVPSEAVLLTGETDRTGKALVFLAEGEVARRREVVVGRRQADQLEVREGLSGGEPLVVSGAHFLRDGDPIRVHEARR